MSVAYRIYTYDDLSAMPDDGNRYEIIGGELIVAPPLLSHPDVVNRINVSLAAYIWSRQLGMVYTAPDRESRGLRGAPLGCGSTIGPAVRGDCVPHGGTVYSG
jgi:hypothetical protein